MRFELIDQVCEHGPDRLIAVKNVTASEEYLADHFPGFPVLPGVLMLESLVQAGRLLLANRPGPLILVVVKNLRYGNMVRPGQTLEIEVTLRRERDDQFDLEGAGRIDGQIAVQGRFTLAPLPMAKSSGETASSSME